MCPRAYNRLVSLSCCEAAISPTATRNMNMTENGYGPTPGHMGRIPNFGKTHVNPMGTAEPPACIQNAMMTKDKKPFTYTPGGLDLSQIRTPSMARRLARQRSQEEHEQAYPQHQANNGGYRPQGGPAPPPPPPPPSVPAPPPPPPLVIQAPGAKAPKPVALGERPEIVIPENPIGMLRKTNSPYHWESEKEQMQRIGPVPKFVEKVPSPLTVKLPSQQASSYNSPQVNNNFQSQNYSYGNQNNQAPDSPLHRPEAQYAHQKSNSPNVNGSPQTRDLLVRQDSQFNKSPQPFGNQSPVPNSSPYSPSPGPNWRQPEKRESPASTANNSPQSPHINRGPFSPNVQQSPPGYQTSSNPVFHTLPRAGQRNQENFVNNAPNNHNNVKEVIQQSPNPEPNNAAPWRTNTLNRHPRVIENQMNNNQTSNQQSYNPPWKANDANNNRNENQYNLPWKQESKVGSQQQAYNPPWSTAQESSNNRVQDNNTNNETPRWSQGNNQRSPPTSYEQPRYQSSISIPVSPRKNNSQPEYNNSPQQKEAVYVNQEPVYYCPESPKSIPPWVKTQKEKTKTPPPVWCQRPLEGRRSVPRDLVTPPRDANSEPEWVRKSNELQRGGREVTSPPKYQQTAQPNWSTLPSENRKSLPRDNNTKGSRIIPIQMEVSSNEARDQCRQGGQQPHLRIVIDMKQNPEAQNQTRAQVPFSPPTQRIMRVLSPQLVRMDEGPPQQAELPTLNRNIQNNQDNQPKTRIIPIQIEGASNGGANRSVYYHNFAQEAAPRQSKAFRVLQIITGTEDMDNYKLIEEHHGFTDL